MAGSSSERALDPESERWVARLSSAGRDREVCVRELHDLLLRAARREVELIAARTVGAKLEAEEAALVDPLENDRADPVAEDDARCPVAPVDDLRQEVTSDDERAPTLTVLGRGAAEVVSVRGCDVVTWSSTDAAWGRAER